MLKKMLSMLLLSFVFISTTHASATEDYYDKVTFSKFAPRLSVALDENANKVILNDALQTYVYSHSMPVPSILYHEFGGPSLPAVPLFHKYTRVDIRVAYTLKLLFRDHTVFITVQNADPMTDEDVRRKQSGLLLRPHSYMHSQGQTGAKIETKKFHATVQNYNTGLLISVNGNFTSHSSRGNPQMIASPCNLKVCDTLSGDVTLLRANINAHKDGEFSTPNTTSLNVLLKGEFYAGFVDELDSLSDKSFANVARLLRHTIGETDGADEFFADFPELFTNMFREIPLSFIHKKEILGMEFQGRSLEPKPYSDLSLKQKRAARRARAKRKEANKLASELRELKKQYGITDDINYQDYPIDVKRLARIARAKRKEANEAKRIFHSSIN